MRLCPLLAYALSLSDGPVGLDVKLPPEGDPEGLEVILKVESVL